MRFRSERGLNTMELMVVCGVLVVLYVIFIGSVIGRLGLTLSGILFAASPVLLIGAVVLVGSAAGMLRESADGRRIERLVAALEARRPAEARREIEGFFPPLPPGLRRAIQARRARIVALIEREPMPVRELAYRMHLTLLDRYRETLSAPLAASTAEWPEDLFAPVLADIARGQDALPAARAFLARSGSEASRRRLLGSFFGIISPVVPPEPAAEWLELLRPLRADLQAILDGRDYPGVPAEHLRRWLRAM
jgi:hypothetical protein